MGKNKQFEIMQWRNEGMAYALDIVKKEGIEGLEKVVNQRFKLGFTCKYVPVDELMAHLDEVKSWYYVAIVSTFLMKLHDLFGFGKKRCTRLTNSFLDSVDSTLRPELGVSLVDFIKEAERIIGMEIAIPARWRQDG